MAGHVYRSTNHEHDQEYAWLVRVLSAMTSIASGASGLSARTKLNNILGTVYNVADYGAVGDWNGSSGTDNTTAIQNAINAANATGGTVFFPYGIYMISAKLTVANSQSSITIKGSGPDLNAAGGGGTILFGNFNDWLLSTGQVNSPQQPIKVIEGISFHNINTTAPVSTDVTPGCIRITSGTGVVIRDCEIDVYNGIGIFAAAGQNHLITNTTINGFYPTYTSSIGAWLGSASIENCKIQGLGTGIICAGNGQCGIVRNIDIEVSGTHIFIGNNPLAWYDSNASYPPLSASADGGGNNLIIENIGMESPFVYGIRIAQCYQALFQNISIGSYQQVCTAGIFIDTAGDGFCHNSTFCRIDINDASSGGYSTGGFVMGEQCDGCTFDTVRVHNNLSSNVQWILPTTTGASADPFIVRNCHGFDGALPFASRYTGPSAKGMTSRFSDCDDPVWTGTVSNVGKPVASSPGTHNILAAWDGAQWCIAGP